MNQGEFDSNFEIKCIPRPGTSLGRSSLEPSEEGEATPDGGGTKFGSFTSGSVQPNGAQGGCHRNSARTNQC